MFSLGGKQSLKSFTSFLMQKNLYAVPYILFNLFPFCLENTLWQYLWLQHLPHDNLSITVLTSSPNFAKKYLTFIIIFVSLWYIDSL